MILSAMYAQHLLRQTKNKCTPLRCTAQAARMTIFPWTTTALLYQPMGSQCSASRPVNTITRGSLIIHASCKSLNLRIAWRQTTHITATITSVPWATSLNKLVKQQHTITTIMITSVLKSMKMHNTATCTEFTTINRHLTVLYCMITPNTVRRLENHTI